MDKILEELKKLEKINSEIKKNLENEKNLKVEENKLKKMYENLQLKMIGTEERDEALKEYEDRKNKIEYIKNKKEATEKDHEEEFSKQKNKIVEEIDKKIEKYEQAKQAKPAIEQAKKERDEKVAQLESQKNAYSKIAQNNRKDIANMLEKINNGERVNMDRLTDAQKEYSANSKKVIAVENEIKELNEKKIEAPEGAEITPEEISDLKYLKARVIGMKSNEIDKMKDDPFVNKYGKEETAQEKDKDSDIKSEKTQDENNNSDTKPEKPQDENNNSDTKPEKPQDENNNSDTKPEKPQEENDNSNTKNIIVLDEYLNTISVNGKQLDDFLGAYRKDGKSLKDDKDLAIGSMFVADKKMLKYIDYGLLKVLNSQDKKLAIEYLNVIRGGGTKSASESVEILKNAVDIKYEFFNDTATKFSFRKKRVARKAVELGIAEIEGINDKSIMKRMTEFFSKVKNTKLLGAKDKPKALQAKIEEKVQENGLGQIKVDNKDNHIEKMAQEKRKQEVKEIMEKDAKKIDPKDVEVIPPENKGPEIGE